MISTLELQRRLTSLGFDPKSVDGIFGRNTIAAVRAFQKAKGLVVDGIVGPQTIGAPNAAETAADAAAAPLQGQMTPPWYSEALRKMGLHETLNNAELKNYLRSDGPTLGDPAKLPWCGDFVETVIALTLPDEPMVANPYWARNWLKFGIDIPNGAPALGAVCVFAPSAKAPKPKRARQNLGAPGGGTVWTWRIFL
jgi:hypothetical protein